MSHPTGTRSTRHYLQESSGKRRCPGCDRPIFRVQLFFVQIWRKKWCSGCQIRSMSNLVIFWEILKIWSTFSLWKFTRNPTFYLLFSRNLGGKSCNSLVWTRSSLDSALQRKNCSLNTQKQPLFWDKSNKNLTIRHLQTATKLDKMSSNWTQNIGLSHPGHAALHRWSPLTPHRAELRHRSREVISGSELNSLEVGKMSGFLATF